MTLASVSSSEASHSLNRPDLITSLLHYLQILELLSAEPEGLLAKTVSFRTGLLVSTCCYLPTPPNNLA
jgi:hypothetical protein